MLTGKLTLFQIIIENNILGEAGYKAQSYHCNKALISLLTGESVVFWLISFVLLVPPILKDFKYTIIGVW